jgi:hypothetical protein
MRARRRMTSRTARARTIARMIQPHGVDDDVGLAASVVVVVDEVVLVVRGVLVVVVIGAVVVVVCAVVVVVGAIVVVVLVDTVDVVGWAAAGGMVTVQRLSSSTEIKAVATNGALRRGRSRSMVEA